MPEVTHIYTWNALVEFDTHGKYAAGGRGSFTAEIHATGPMSEDDLKQVIGRDLAEKRGMKANGITFVEFIYTTLAAS